MSLVTPSLALAGLLAIAIPIAIHLLLRMRRRPIQWGAMRLLREAMRETSRRRRLENLLVLALRCLVVALLGLALAQPLLRGGGALDAGGRAVILLIDDSLTASVRPDAVDPSRTALAESIARGEEIIRDLRPGDAVGIIALARPTRPLLLPPTTDHAGASTLLKSMRPRETVADLPQGLTALREAIDQLGAERSVVGYLLGEFREGSVDLQAALPRAFEEVGSRRLRLLVEPPAEHDIANVRVVEVEPLRSLLLPGQSDGSGLVVVRLARSGPLESSVTRVSLDGDFRPVPPRTVRWDSGQAETSVEFIVDPSTPDVGAVALTVMIDEDAMPGDDRRHAVLQTRREINVALLDRRAFGSATNVGRLGGGQWILRALDPDRSSPISITVEDPAALGPATLRGADAIVISRPDLLDVEGWRQVRQRLATGGVAIVVPPEELNVHLWADRVDEWLGIPWRVGIEPSDFPDGLALDERQPAAPLLRLLAGELSELARPVLVNRALPFDLNAAGEPLLVGADGSVLAATGTPRDEQGRALPGLVVLFAFAPDLVWSNLPTKPLMVPLFQELVRQGIGISTEAQRLTTGESPLTPLGAAELVRLDDSNVRVAVAPNRTAAMMRSGLYRIDDAAGESMGLVAVNVDLDAAETTPLGREAVLAWLRGSGPWSYLDPEDPIAALRTVEMAAPISGLLLSLALICAILESLLARRFSRAEARSIQTVSGSIPGTLPGSAAGSVSRRKRGDSSRSSGSDARTAGGVPA